MSFFRPRNIAIITAVPVAAYLYSTVRGGTLPINPLETPASKSIGERWSAGGGTTVHTPGVATRRGDSTDNMEPQLKPKGVGSDHYDENIASQKTNQPNAAGKAWHQAHYGNEKGK